MRMKKILALILAAVMAGSIVTGCFGQKTSVTEPESTTTISGEDESIGGGTTSGNTEENTTPDYTQSDRVVEKGMLSNPNADKKTQKIYEYIWDNYGTNIITCQQESTWKGTPDYEMNYIEETTGKLPAMRGLDFMNNDFNGVVSRAKAWAEKGGLVTICWHTGIASSGYQESLDDRADFSKLLTPGTDEYNTLMASWDKAAKALLRLQDAGVTVFWRPFHEFDGRWFWWGKAGANKFVQLWQLMYNKFTYEYGLNNLIWVLGYTGSVRDGWYPGDEYCDIIGSDSYDNNTNVSGYNKLLKVSENKPLCFHECGNVPLIEDFENDKAMWSWFMIWHTDHLMANDKDTLSAVYNSDKAITLDKLPEF